MGQRITVIQGHPEPRLARFGHALEQRYDDGARAAGHEVRQIRVALLEFPMLRTQEEWRNSLMPEGLRAAQQDILWADHLVLLFPLWLGSLPALLKGFLEQVLRAAGNIGSGEFPTPLKGKSVRIIVTMGMPAPVFRFYFLSHGVRFIERSIFRFCGARPVRSSIIGSVEGSTAARTRWLTRVAALGEAGR